MMQEFACENSLDKRVGRPLSPKPRSLKVRSSKGKIFSKKDVLLYLAAKIAASG
jgi:hypothetical protein